MSPTGSPVRRVIVIGGGPAGLMAAGAAAEVGARVCLLERHAQCGRKLLVTGGGRCNLTHEADRDTLAAAFDAARRFVRPAFAQADATWLRTYFAHRGVPTHALEDGCVFPDSEQAGDVLAALLSACRAAGVSIRTGAAASELLTSGARITGVRVEGESLSADAVVLATGSPAWGGVGADDAGMRLARDVEHPVTPLYPALAPLFHDEADLHAMSGHVLPSVHLRLEDLRRHKGWNGALLLTHTGFSGPVAINASGAVAQRLAETGRAVPVRLHLTPERDAVAWDEQFRLWQRTDGKKRIATLLAPFVGSRLAVLLCTRSGGAEVHAGECPRDVRRAVIDHLTAWRVEIVRTGRMKGAMVARGGLERSAFVPATLESRVVSGLYAAGEVLDCDGACGGFNLQWAFSSGHLAGTSAALRGSRLL